jgi:hypothetical protein
VATAGQLPDKEAHAFIAQLPIGSQSVMGVTALDFHGLKAGGFLILENDVLVIVLRFDYQFDFDQIAALDSVQVI